MPFDLDRGLNPWSLDWVGPRDFDWSITEHSASQREGSSPSHWEVGDLQKICDCSLKVLLETPPDVFNARLGGIKRNRKVVHLLCKTVRNAKRWIVGKQGEEKNVSKVLIKKE